MNEDTRLVDAWRRGDRAAGERVIARHYPLIFRFLRTKVEEDAEDLVQRTFLTCIERRDDLRSAGSLRAYLLAVARHELVAYYRRKGRCAGRQCPLQSSVESLAQGPSSWVYRKRRQQRLYLAMRRIPLELQIVLELYYWENLTALELSSVLELPEGTVRGRIRRAKELLLADLGPDADQALSSDAPMPKANTPAREPPP